MYGLTRQSLFPTPQVSIVNKKMSVLRKNLINAPRTAKELE